MKTRAQVGMLVLVGALSFLWPTSAQEKRKAPAPVPPVVWQGVEYRAPLDVEHMGRIQAFDLSSGRLLWETKAYDVWINPLSEEDLQWVFVSRLQVQDGSLLVRNEDGKSYKFDLKTGRREGSMRSRLVCFLAGCFLVSAAFFVWVRRR